VGAPGGPTVGRQPGARVDAVQAVRNIMPRLVAYFGCCYFAVRRPKEATAPEKPEPRGCGSRARLAGRQT